MMKKYLFFLLILFFLCVLSSGQNLMPNPSFENYVSCPLNGSSGGCVAYDAVSEAFPWYLPTCGTADYFNQCNDTINGNVSVPQNGLGYQLARTGIAYTGIIAYQNVSEWREYIQAPLIDSLKMGKTYYAEMYISLADNWNCAADGMGMYFSNGPPDTTGVGSDVLPYIPQISNTPGNLLTDMSNWMEISGTFIAAGGENYITIGNFKDNANTQNGCGGVGKSYYYIDDVLLVEDTITAIDDLLFTNDNVRIYPNPFNEKAIVEIKLKVGNPKPVTFILFDPLGRKVKEIREVKGKKFELGRDGLSSGIYFYTVEYDHNQVIGRGKLIIY